MKLKSGDTDSTVFIHFVKCPTKCKISSVAGIVREF